MSRFEYLLSSAVLRLCFLLCRIFPVDHKKVVFASARSDELQDNLKFIHSEMASRHPDYRYVFLLERYSYSLGGKLAYMASMLCACYHLATARLFIVDNAYLPVHLVQHRAETIVIQVWHAASALKRFGLDAPSSDRAVEDRFVHKNYDYVVVGSETAVEPFASALRTDPARVVVLGEARTDLFFDTEMMDSARERVYERYPMLRGRHVALYAPTFRGAGPSKHPAHGLDAPLVREALGGEWLLASKVHPALAFAGAASSDGFDVCIGHEVELNELLLVTDLLITDYSSAIFEYALLRQPLILYVPDLADYRSDPGFYLDFPDGFIGGVAHSMEELTTLIERAGYDMGVYDEFLARHLSLADGRASERFVSWAETL